MANKNGRRVMNEREVQQALTELVDAAWVLGRAREAISRTAELVSDAIERVREAQSRICDIEAGQ